MPLLGIPRHEPDAVRKTQPSGKEFDAHPVSVYTLYAFSATHGLSETLIAAPRKPTPVHREESA
jgi:hypothetical protein